MKVHFMGVSGSGVKSVYTIASKMGFDVSGCDLKTGGHDTNHVKDIDKVVVSPAVLFQNPNHPEVVEAKQKGILMTWEEFAAKFILKDKKLIAVCGTHGKSTTTAMVGRLLEDCGFDPLVILGAHVPAWGENGRYGTGEWAVIEADEFNDNFLHYEPSIIILNNIEFDHPDYFKNESDVFESFKKFVQKLKQNKVLIANIDDGGVRKLLDDVDTTDLKVIKYRSSDWDDGLVLKVLGEHNKLNALGVIKLGEFLKIEKERIYESLSNFSGIGRRMEYLGESKSGLLVYDDYAHHPTAVKSTLHGARQHFGDKKIFAVIEPHGFSRTSQLLNSYEGAFDDADGVIIGPIFKARDKETFGMDNKKVAEVSGHKNIFACDNLDQVMTLLRDKTKSDEVIIVMGAGESNLWAQQILNI